VFAVSYDFVVIHGSITLACGMQHVAVCCSVFAVCCSVLIIEFVSHINEIWIVEFVNDRESK